MDQLGLFDQDTLDAIDNWGVPPEVVTLTPLVKLRPPSEWPKGGLVAVCKANKVMGFVNMKHKDLVATVEGIMAKRAPA